MLLEIVLSVLSCVLSVVSGVILIFCTRIINKARSDKEAEAKKSQAIANGVEALLRESIINTYNKYSEKGYCPVYAKESLKRAYSAYHGLDGNDVATGLYHKCLNMPENPPEETRI